MKMLLRWWLRSFGSQKPQKPAAPRSAVSRRYVLEDEMGGTTWWAKSHLEVMNLPWTRKLCFEIGGGPSALLLRMSEDPIIRAFPGGVNPAILAYSMNRDKGREILRLEAAAIQSLAERLGPEFDTAVNAILDGKGHVVVTGMGKAGLVAQKISATFASTGTPSIFLHPAEAYHGDLGRVLAADVVLAISNSGETEEVVRLL